MKRIFDFDLERFSKVKKLLSNDIADFFVFGLYYCFICYMSYLYISYLGTKNVHMFWVAFLEELCLFPLYTVIYLLFISAVKTFFVKKKMYNVAKIMIISGLILSFYAFLLFSFVFKYDWSLFCIFMLIYKLSINLVLFSECRAVTLKYLTQIEE